MTLPQRVCPALLGLMVGLGLLIATQILQFHQPCLSFCRVLHYSANETLLFIYEIAPLRTQSSQMIVENTIFVLQWMAMTICAMGLRRSRVRD